MSITDILDGFEKEMDKFAKHPDEEIDKALKKAREYFEKYSKCIKSGKGGNVCKIGLSDERKEIEEIAEEFGK